MLGQLCYNLFFFPPVMGIEPGVFTLNNIPGPFLF